MNIKDRIAETLLNSFNKLLNEKLDSSNTLSPDQIDQESEEFKRAGIPIKNAYSGRGVSLPSKEFGKLKVVNTDVDQFTGNDSRFSKLRNWARLLKGYGRDKARRRNAFNQVISNTDQPSIIAVNKGKRELVAGNSRASLRAALNMPIKAHIFRHKTSR